MKREILFKAKRKDNGEWVEGNYVSTIDEEAFILMGITGHIKRDDYEVYMCEVIPETVCQFTGLLDRNGCKIFEGDLIECKRPYRTTQTHTGDNIPNGSYTEPMEPGIKFISGEVIFKNGCFALEEDTETPLCFYQVDWDLESIKQSISWTRQSSGWLDDPEEGDLQYLITECAKVETTEQLIEYLNGFEITGNIHD